MKVRKPAADIIRAVSFPCPLHSSPLSYHVMNVSVIEKEPRHYLQIEILTEYGVARYVHERFFGRRRRSVEVAALLTKKLEGSALYVRFDHTKSCSPHQ